MRQSPRVAGELDGLAADSYDDRELTLAFQRGEEGAYQAIYERHSARVRAVCRRMLGQSDDAQEAAQEAFLRVYMGLRGFNGRYQLGAWIARIATNVCVDHLRARSRRPSEAELVEEIDSDQRYDADPEQMFQRDAEGRRVRRVLASLPPLHRAAIVLRDFEGFSYQEIAVALGLSDTQVKALLHRARRGFRRSWTRIAVSALVPTRFLGKLKRAEQPNAATHANEILGSAAQVTTSCPGVLQQCAQVVSERLAPVVTAALVGSTGVAVAMSGAVTPGPDPAELAARPVASSPAAPAATKKAPKRTAVAPDSAASVAPKEASVPAQNQASPSPTPSPTPSPQESPSPSPQPSSSPTPVPEPAGFTLSFATGTAESRDPCPCIEDTQVHSEKVAVTPSGMERFDQELSGSASVEDTPTFGLRLDHAGTAGNYEASFTLINEEGTYNYRAVATAETRRSTKWGGWVYVYRGTYDLTGAPTRSDDMPGSGTYWVEITVSPKARVVAVSVALGT